MRKEKKRKENRDRIMKHVLFQWKESNIEKKRTL